MRIQLFFNNLKKQQQQKEKEREREFAVQTSAYVCTFKQTAAQPQVAYIQPAL